MGDEPTLEFWKNMALGLKDEMIQRGDRLEEIEAAFVALCKQVPIDEIEWVISRYFFQVERGQDARLDRIYEWLDQVKPIEGYRG